MRCQSVSVCKKVVDRTARRCAERGILIPTFAEMKDPRLVPEKIRRALKTIGLWDIHPLNLFRITWKNDPESGGFGKVNFIEIPSSLSGVNARIVGLVGKFFPTGAHKVGASFGCLVPRLVTGNFDPTVHKAVWPSTGNYCRGGAYDSRLLGCEAIAILPQEMSRERFDWLKEIGAEVIATPGCESNVKEIYDKCWELKKTRDDVVVFNQFDEFGNGMWHYEVTAAAIQEAFETLATGSERLAAYVSATGSAGTLAAGDRLKELHPGLKIVAAEALQCPTLLQNGFGGHRIEGIGDKHVPWIHNTRNTDLVVAIDDNDPMALIRLFNEPAGRAFLRKQNVPAETVDRLDLLGISSVANLLACIKTARRLHLGERDVLFTVFTDSIEMYRSRLLELERAGGRYSERQAALDFEVHLRGQHTDFMRELDTQERLRIHNLKYFTWIEQQQKDILELRAQWDEYQTYWPLRWRQAGTYDTLIKDFNRRSGMTRKYH
jgi:cysteine synthase